MRVVWWIIGGLVFTTLFLGLGEFGIDGLCVSFVLLGGFSSTWCRKLTLVALGLIGLGLQLSPYRIYGSRRVVPTPELAGARVVTALESPSRIRFGDGGTAELQGVYFPRAVKLDDLNDVTWRLYYNVGERSRTPAVSVRVTADGRADFKRRLNYSCGNTFFPTFFPQPLPRHQVEDFGLCLVNSGLALPSAAALTSEEDSAALRSFDSSTDEFYSDAGHVHRGDEWAITLGRRLATPASHHFIAGAYLLVAAQDLESYPAIAGEIKRRHQVIEDQYDEIAQTRSGSLDDVLAWVDREAARRQAGRVPFVVSSNSWQTSHAWARAAQVLASQGDLTGFDAALRAWTSGSASEAEALAYAARVPPLFRWPQNTPGFERWYTSLRPILRAGRDEWGRSAFWLDGGEPFDQRYLDSMDSFIGAAAQR